ncbi:hypothetical protein HJC23_009773 [Cyclotella cryptica]|uniref:glucan endo-1,3-beta-D-glucosidase n=1 Tax=Cyclotella cryptica TaxID=29204 RepID=A0ABD3PRA1_9STRA|eukprot:CCRYP_012130-RA/>CCRYP_012130-RA protein AED:0.14 eAED:0.14 QI:39/1/1/1/1/1/5/2446/1207
MTKGYGSTSTTNEPSTPSLTRNEQSIGGGTSFTNESEPLLGERLLLGNDEYDGNATPVMRRPNAEEGKLFYTDVSTIGKEDSDDENADPHIGINVFTNDDSNTLSYSRDFDDSTLGDRYFRETSRKGSYDAIDEGNEEEEGNGGRKRQGIMSVVLPEVENSRQVYFLVCFGLAVGIAMCAVAALAYIEYWHHYGVDVLPDQAGNSTAGGSTAAGDKVMSDGSAHGVPFRKISRDSFGDPVSNILDVDLFHPSLFYRGDSKRTIEGERMAQPFFKFPFPTGAFWTNLVLHPVENKQQQQGQLSSLTQKENDRDKNQYSYPIVAYPYSFQWSPLGKLQASYSAARRTAQPDSIHDAFAPDITFGSVEEISARRIVKFDSLSVSLRFYSDGSKDGGSTGYWESYIVQGSPYITACYFGLTPELTALSDFEDIACPPVMNQLKVKMDGLNQSSSSNSTKRRMLSSTTSATGPDTAKMLGICDVSDDSTQQSKVITGVQFVVTTKEQLALLVFASDPITFIFRKDARHSITSKDLFGGVIRVALVPPAASKADGSMVPNSLDLDYLSSSSGVKRLIYHADAYPIGGSVSWDFRSGTRSPLAATSSGGSRSTLGSDNDKGIASTSTERNIGTITFQFDTMHMTQSSPSSKVPLLMLSLPHHAASISSAEEMLLEPTEFDLLYRTIKGRMTPIVGNSWSYEVELTTIGFGDEPIAKPSPSASVETKTKTTLNRHQTTSEFTAVAALDQSIRDLILQTVDSDLKINLPDIANGAYGFGKQIARLAQLAHIAERVETENAITNPQNRSIPATSSVGGQARRAYALLEMYLIMWLAGDDGSGRLVYDANLGGILSKEGTKDVFSDFGNGRYNDHHFHYGYVLYAAAVLGRRSPHFVSQYGSYIDAIFYDVAHNSNAIIKNGKKDDAFFPFARHKSWFDGHSFASGLFPFADGKSQESSSEATNCYYGAYLWSKVRWGGSADGNKLVNFARLLLATELTGAKTYWHMVPQVENGDQSAGNRRLVNSWQPPRAYSSLFEKNYMVGNLGMTDVTCTTWFGTEKVYVHLINFMPVTAITSELFDKGYVKEEMKALSDSASIDYAWKGYAVCHKAILEPTEAWTDAQSLISNQLDPGLSKSQVLYWVSTREGFAPSTEAITSPGNDIAVEGGDDSADSTIPQGRSSSSDHDSSCEGNERCAAINLVGQCCPTSEGMFLSCCN